MSKKSKKKKKKLKLKRKLKQELQKKLQKDQYMPEKKESVTKTIHKIPSEPKESAIPTTKISEESISQNPLFVMDLKRIGLLIILLAVIILIIFFINNSTGFLSKFGQQLFDRFNISP